MLVCMLDREPISGDLKLALAMALHPRLGQDSQLFMLAYLPPSPFKTGVTLVACFIMTRLTWLVAYFIMTRLIYLQPPSA